MAGETKRVALVIGNGLYAHASVLANPGNDARGMAAALTRIGFSGVSPDGQDFTVSFKTPGVTALANLEYNPLRRALAAFGRAAEHADQAVLYYAGHGIEVGGSNYLIPVDAKLAHAKDVEFETASLMQVLGAVDGTHGLRLVVLDACRDNPFRARLFPSREVSRGLRAIEPAGNILVAYAAKHGTVALDGKGSNSPYATALLAHLEEPGLEIVDLFREVKDEVLEATGNRQEPYLYGSLGRRREYLVPPAPAEPLPPEPAPFDERAVELQWWEKIKQTEDERLLAEFLQRFPEGAFAALARDRLGEVEWKRLKNSRDAAEIEAFQERWKSTRFEGPAAARLEALRRREEQGGHVPWKTAASAAVFAAVLAAGYFLWPKPFRPPLVPHPGMVAVTVRAASGRDEVKWRKPGAGESFRDCINRACTNSPEMVVVPAGRFLMGSLKGEDGRDGDEGPRHEVDIAKPFAAGRTHITRGEFAAFVKAADHKVEGGCYTWSGSEWKLHADRSWRSPGFEQDDTHPVVCVNWNDATTYAKWLSETTGKSYRLLSEAEAEYVTRGVTKLEQDQPRYFFGNNETELCTYANEADATLKAKFPNWPWTTNSCRDGYVFTAPVAQFKQNAFGLYDVHGNAWTWTQDCYQSDYNGVPSNGSAWTPGKCSLRVLRGGSWYNDPRILRAAFRNRGTPVDWYDSIGFRLARTLNP